VRQVKAPDRPNAELRIFLAGSIEMGEAEQWQRRVVDAMADVDNLVILNPRRDDWDSSWEQQAANAQFVEQVNWELDMLDAADVIVMYLAPDTMSPISLLELGLYAKSGKLKVCCPSGFWRRGNVEVVCQRHNIPLFDDLEELLASLYAPRR
jgi:nucleoside 2-deoxyribosyltransferase